jgi:hypothetical protein
MPATIGKLRKLPVVATVVGAFRYPLAGIGAPKGTQRAVEAYRALPMHVRERAPLLSWLLGPPAKAGGLGSLEGYLLPKAEALYVDKAEGASRCALCAHAVGMLATREVRCLRVQGIIEPAGGCRYWTPAPPGPVGGT